MIADLRVLVIQENLVKACTNRVVCRWLLWDRKYETDDDEKNHSKNEPQVITKRRSMHCT